MIRTVLTLRMGSQDMQDTTFLINDTQIGFLSPGGRKNHVLSSHRYLQLVAGLKSISDDPLTAATQQRENLKLWQRCSRDIQQRGLSILTQAAVHYGLKPEWLIGIDDNFMHAWLLEHYGIYLMRDGELFQVEPVSDNQIKVPESWRGHLHQSTIEILEGDYYLFLPPDFFNVVTSEEVQNILSGLQQLSVKINELVELARLRKYDMTETWMAIQIQKIEPDTQQPVRLMEQWKSFRKNLKKPSPDEVARMKSRNSSLRQTTSLSDESETDNRLNMNARTGIHETNNKNVNLKSGNNRNNGETKATQKRGSLIDYWYSWTREKKLLSVIIALAIIILLAWGISGLLSNDDSDINNGLQTTESTLQPTPTPLPPTVTTTEVPVEIKMVVNVRSLNFRELPSKEAALITTLPEGSSVTKIGEAEEGWIKVLLEDGTEAYAFTEYLTESNSEESSNNQ